MTATLFDDHRSTWAAAAVSAALAALAAVLLLVDPRTLEGASVWSKPTKFSLSFALHLVTLILLARLTAPDTRTGPTMALLLGAASAATLIEVFAVFVQAARGRASHFNAETPLDSFLYYQVMGGAALVIVGATIGLGVLIAARPEPAAGPGLRLGAVLGLIAGGIATLVVAGAMASGALTPTGRWIGGSLSAADGLPVLGWSTTGGDLRAPHFFATHLVQATPLVGLLGDRLAPSAARAAVWCALVLGLGLVAATFAQALAGAPFIALGQVR